MKDYTYIDFDENFLPNPDDGWDIHYAALNGGLCAMNDDVIMRPKGWSAHHAFYALFSNLREENKIILKETINYGHVMYHGHSGKVDVYTKKN